MAKVGPKEAGRRAQREAASPLTRKAKPVQEAAWPCRSKPRDQWCDHSGPGGFMGHTCFATAGVLMLPAPDDPDEVRRALAFYRAHRARQRLAAQRRAKAKKGTR